MIFILHILSIRSGTRIKIGRTASELSEPWAVAKMGHLKKANENQNLSRWKVNFTYSSSLTFSMFIN